MKIRPLGARLLVKPEEPPRTVRGGIIIPDSAKGKPQEGEVVAVGKGRVDEHGRVIPMEVRIGDRILIGKYSGAKVEIDGKEHIILSEEDVLAVIGAGSSSAHASSISLPGTPYTRKPPPVAAPPVESRPPIPKNPTPAQPRRPRPKKKKQ